MTHLTLRLAGNDFSRLAPRIYFLLGTAHRLFAQLFGPVISYAQNDDAALAFFPVNISQGFPSELKRFASFTLTNRNMLERKPHCAARRTNLSANPSSPLDVSLPIVWWITCRCRCTFSVMQHGAIGAPCAWCTSVNRVYMTRIIDRSRDSTIANACSTEFLRIYTRVYVNQSSRLYELIFCLLAHRDRWWISIGCVK